MKEQQEQSVLSLIAERIKKGSKPLQRNDGAHIGLVIEGGGMKGVRTGGMVSGLQRLNALPAFDEIFGVSSGAWASAFFAADQAPLGTSIYYQDLIRNFISGFHLLKGRPIMDTEYLMDIMKYKKPLNTRKLLSLSIPLHIYSACVESKELVDFYPYQTEEDILVAMSTTPRLPLITRPVEHNGKHYIDGGVLLGGPLCLQQALESECTHLLVLLSNSEDKIDKLKRRPPSSLWDRFVKHAINRKHPELGSIYHKNLPAYLQALQILYGSIEVDLNKEITALELPSGSTDISRLDTNGPKLYRGAIEGYLRVLDAFKDFDLPQRDNISLIPL